MGGSAGFEHVRFPVKQISIYILLIVGLVTGCDGLVEEIDEDRSVLGAYAASDSLVVSFVPGDAYDEQNESPYLPDTSFRLLESGGSLHLTLTAESGNKGMADLEWVIPDSLYIDADSTFVLLPDTTVTFEGPFITVIDRIILQPPVSDDDEGEENSSPIPLRWLVQADGGLLGEAQRSVVRPVTRFDTQRGRFITRNEQLGTFYVRASLLRE